MATRKGSNASITSKGSVSSNQSTKSKLSSLFSLGSRGSNVSRSENFTVEIGDKCESVSSITVRITETLDSDVICELPIGTSMEVTGVGTIPRRAMVKATTPNGEVEGWISIKTKLNELLIRKRYKDVEYAVEDFEVGGQHEVKSMTTLRAAEPLDSDIIGEFKAGTIIKIVEIGTQNKRRAKVCSMTEPPVEGWLSLVTMQGEFLVGKVSTTQRSRAHGGGNKFGIASAKIKDVLEAARLGDLETLKAITEGGSKGFMSKFSGKPSLNAADVRGKTPLIYATAFGREETVEYLLGKPDVDVHLTDDTQKSALHHACKRQAQDPVITTGDNTQCRIIKRLIAAGSYIEGRDHNGCTPLMFTVANGDLLGAQVMLEARSNINAKDFEGHTPLDYANHFGHTELLKCIRDLGGEGMNEDDAEEEDDDDLGGEGVADEPEVVEDVAEPAPAAGEEAAPAKPKKKGASKKDGEEKGEKAEKPEKEEKGEKAAKGGKKKKAAGSKDKGDGEEKAEGAKKGEKKKKAAEGDEEKAGEKKSKKKDAKKGGKAGKDKRPSIAMAYMAEELAAPVAPVTCEETGAQVEPVMEAIAVDETPAERVEKDEKEVTFDKLEALMKDKAVTTKELEVAIKNCEDAGVDAGKLADAQKRVATQKEKAGAANELQQAINSKDVTELKTAIANAKKNDVPKAEITKAEKILAEEEPKEKARDALRAAESAGDMDKLKAAIKEAKKAKVPDDEIAEYEELLKGAENKEAAEKALNDAITSREVGALKFAIQQATTAKVDDATIKKAQGILDEEEPKLKAREVLAEMFAKLPAKDSDIPAIQAAVEQAKAANLPASEYTALEEEIKLVALRKAKLAELATLFEQLKTIDEKDIEVLQKSKDDLSKAILDTKEAGVAEADLMEYDLRRRKLHNMVEDLKGAIRVFCRVRPLSGKEKGNNEADVSVRVDPMTIEVATKRFMFDAVFKPGTQAEVYEECRDLVQSAADGYNVTLFAYGQTGAGKTYTMGGTPTDPGVSRRTLDEIFKVCEAGSARCTFTVLGSMIELYRQDLIDLTAVAKEGRGNVKKMNIRNDKSGAVVLEGLTETECADSETLSDVLETGMAARKVMATSMNAESSRSHLIFCIKIISINKETKERLLGKILIVDLAGSERLSKSQVTGDGAKEAIEINKSLTALGDVVEALTKNSKQIPYRNHKLTELMKDALGGSAKTLMFVNCSPAASNSEETTNALNWAARAKKITKDIKKA